MMKVSTPVLTSGTELDWGAKGTGGGGSPQSSSLEYLCKGGAESSSSGRTLT